MWISGERVRLQLDEYDSAERELDAAIESLLRGVGAMANSAAGSGHTRGDGTTTYDIEKGLACVRRAARELRRKLQNNKCSYCFDRWTRCIRGNA